MWGRWLAGGGAALAQPGQGGLGQVDQVCPDVAVELAHVVDRQQEVVVAADEQGRGVQGRVPGDAGADLGLARALGAGEGEGRRRVAGGGVVAESPVLVVGGDEVGVGDQPSLGAGRLDPARGLRHGSGSVSGPDSEVGAEHGLDGRVRDTRACVGVVVRSARGDNSRRRRRGTTHAPRARAGPRASTVTAAATADNTRLQHESADLPHFFLRHFLSRADLKTIN